MLTPGIKKLLENNAISLATVDKNRKPHSIAVACIKVIGQNIVITNVHIKETLKNLKINNDVSLSVWNKNWETACIGFEIKGKAQYFTSGKWSDYVKSMPDNKGYNVKGAIVVRPTKIKKYLSD